jgi:hypothetical protein
VGKEILTGLVVDDGVGSAVAAGTGWKESHIRADGGNPSRSGKAKFFERVG